MTIIHGEPDLAQLIVQLHAVPGGGPIDFDGGRVRYIVVHVGHQIEAQLVRRETYLMDGSHFVISVSRAFPVAVFIAIAAIVVADGCCT